MEVITYRGRLLELTVLGDVINDELVLEVWDLSAAESDPDALWFSFVLPAGGHQIMLRASAKPIHLDLLRDVMGRAEVELVEEQSP